MKCPLKRRALFEKYMIEKRYAVIKVTSDIWKKILPFEKIVISHNAKYVKLLKRNKVKSSFIRGL